MRTDVEYLEYMWPMRHYLISCGDINARSNIIAISFCMPVSKEPPLLAWAVRPETHSYELIRENPEFIVNVPFQSLKSKIYYCGFNSGSDVDKFKETGLTAKPAKSVAVPIIDDCVAFMECKVIDDVKTGDKRLIVGEVLEAYADGTVTQSSDFAKGDFPKKIYSGRL